MTPSENPEVRSSGPFRASVGNYKGETLKLAYNGPYRSVSVPALRRTCEKGEAIDIEDARLIDALKAQGWTEPKHYEEKDGDDD